MRRCRWCGVFVKRTALPTIKALPASPTWWAERGYEPWPARLCVQLLCPSCSHCLGVGLGRDILDPRGLPLVHR